MVIINDNKDLQAKLAEKSQGQSVEKKGATMFDVVKAQEAQIKKALPKMFDPERFVRVTLTALRINPKLQMCTPESFLGALLTAAQMGLEPNTPLGHGYLIPYNNKRGDKWVMEASFQTGYKGLIDLCWRTGEFLNIYAHSVHEKDFFEYEYGLESTLKHKPSDGERGAVIGYYAVYKLKNGGFGFAYMTVQQIKDHRDKFSKAADKAGNPWKENFDEMAKKTVLKKALKLAPMSIEGQRALALDGGIKREIADDMSEVPNEMIDITPDSGGDDGFKPEQEQNADADIGATDGKTIDITPQPETSDGASLADDVEKGMAAAGAAAGAGAGAGTETKDATGQKAGKKTDKAGGQSCLDPEKF